MFQKNRSPYPPPPPPLISKKCWKYVKSKTNSTKIPETVWYKNQFRSKPIDQANLFNEFFFDQFSLESKYDLEIDMESNDRFFDVKFHELDVFLLLKGGSPLKFWKTRFRDNG